MKRSLLFLYAITMSMAITAQTGALPMVVEGRTWNVVTITHDGPSETGSGYYDILGRKGRVFGQNTYIFEGDIVLNGVTYKRLMSDGKFRCGMREEDGRIYMHVTNGWSPDHEVLLYDFNAQPGDVFEDPNDGTGIQWMQVEQVGQVSVNGQNRRCMVMYRYTKDPIFGKELGGRFADYWIEGIGCTGNPYFTFWRNIIGNWPLLLSCYDGDECIFNIEEFSDAVSSIEASVNDAPKIGRATLDEPIYDLQGRRLSAKPQKGLYIQNGKKKVVK